jgi:Icc-related predicted phosphoesterase
MLYQNVSAITVSVGSDRQQSRVMQLVKDSREVLIRCRTDGAWDDQYNTTLILPYPYTGASQNIWLVSDTHVETTTARDNFIDAIVDLNGSVDYVFVLGDTVQLGEDSQLAYYVDARSHSWVPRNFWYEIPGNHDDNPYTSGDFSNWKSKVGVSELNFAVDIGNIHFIFVGELIGTTPGELSSDALTFLQTELANNTDKNLVVLTHHGVYNTTYRTTEEGFYLKPNATIQSIISTYRIDAWFQAHSHTINVQDDFSLQKPLAIYSSQDLSDSLETNPITNPLSDSLQITENLSICPSITRSLYGTFKYGARKYGLNLSINTPLKISEDLSAKFNGEMAKWFYETQSISEQISKFVGFNRDFSDSLSVAETSSRKIVKNLSDGIYIYDASTSGKVKSLSDSLSISEYYEIERTETPSLKSDWKFLIKDPSTGKYTASLVNATERWFTQILNDGCEAGFRIDADDEMANTSILNLGVSELDIFYKDTLIWSGQLEIVKKVIDGNNLYWEYTAKDWVAMLSKRNCGVESIRVFTTTDAGTIARTLIEETQALTYGSFGITIGTIETSISRSPSYDKKNVLDAIRELSNQGNDGSSDYGFDFEITPSKVFNVYYPYKGTIQQEVVFRYPDNIVSMEVLYNSWDIVNHEWGLGQHWTGNTAIVSRSDATSQSVYKRREAIKNYRDMSTLEFLQDMVWQDIQWLKNPSMVISFNARVDEKTDILNYSVGDAICLVCDKFDLNEWLWVYERKVKIGNNDQLEVSLVVGE